MDPSGGSLVNVRIDAEPLFSVGPLTVENSMVGAVLASTVLLLAAWYFTRRAGVVPTRVQSLVEMPIEWMSGIVRTSGGTRWQGFAGFILALFLFILVANWLSILPGVGTIGLLHHKTDGSTVLIPFVRPASADLNFTLGLAIVSFVTFVSWALRIHGVRGYLKELRGEPAYMAPLMMPIHVISELSRLISLSMRLFGNVFAGEVLLATMLALVPLLVPAVFMGLELIFGFVQALVFALLSMTYIVLAVGQHADEGNAHGATAEAAIAQPAGP